MCEALAEGLARLQIILPEEILKQEMTFLDELLRWNRRVNLTAIRDRREALEKHLIDSLILLAHLPEKANLLDMGSGGGLPGIPLAIARPGLQVVSVDSVGKKINFQKHVKRQMKLDNLLPIHARLEELAEQLPAEQRFELVVARAFASLEQMLELAAPWLQEGGRLLAMKGPDTAEEVRESEARLSGCGFRILAVEAYQLPFSRAERRLLRLQRTSRAKN